MVNIAEFKRRGTASYCVGSTAEKQYYKNGRNNLEEEKTKTRANE
jgi:hypothetical protein